MFQQFRYRRVERRAFNALAEQRYAEALEAFNELMKLRPDQHGLRHNVGLCHVGLRQYATAEKCFLRELETFGEHNPRLRALSDLYYMWGKRESAATFYRRVLAENPEGDDAPLARLRIEICADPARFARVDEAQTAFEQGNEHAAAGRAVEAIEAYKRSIEADPSQILAYNNIGSVTLNKLNDPDAAMQWFERAAALQKMPLVMANMQRARAAQERATKGKRR